MIMNKVHILKGVVSLLLAWGVVYLSINHVLMVSITRAIRQESYDQMYTKIVSTIQGEVIRPTENKQVQVTTNAPKLTNKNESKPQTVSFKRAKKRTVFKPITVSYEEILRALGEHYLGEVNETFDESLLANLKRIQGTLEMKPNISLERSNTCNNDTLQLGKCSFFEFA